MLGHIYSQIFMLGWGIKIRQSDGWKRPTTQEIRLSVCSKLSQGSMACARIHDSQTCCDALDLSHSVLPGFSPEMKIAGVQSLWPSPYFIACFTRFGRAFV